MLSKIKGFYNLTEDIEQLNTAFVTFKTLMNDLSGQMKSEIAELKDLKNYQMEYLESYKRNVTDIEKVKEQLKRELEDFRVLKLQTQRSVLEKFERELQQNFLKYGDDLKVDKEKYLQVKEKVDATIQNIFMLNAEIGKLTEISKKLKESDFNLVKMHESIINEDKNKLELMQRIDELERILAKMKKSEPKKPQF